MTHEAPGEPNLPHFYSEHWGLRESIPSRVAPMGLFECKLSGGCSAEEEEDTLRLQHAAEVLSAFDLVATLCQILRERCVTHRTVQVEAGPGETARSIFSLFRPKKMRLRDQNHLNLTYGAEGSISGSA